MWKSFENILSPNQRWLNQEKFQSFKLKIHWVWESKNKFKVQTDWDIFKLFSKYLQFNIEVNGNSMYPHGIWERKRLRTKFSFTNKIYKGTQMFQFKFN